MARTYFGRIEFIGGHYVVTVPDGLVESQGLHSGDTVEVQVDNLAVTV